MRIAILISGFLRTFLYNIKKNKEVFKEHECDYYIHVSRNEELDRYNNEKTNLNEIKHICNPKYLILENEIEVNDFPNIRRMWYKINLLNELKKTNENLNNFNYDIVIRLRPDLYIIDEKINFSIENNIIYAKKVENFYLDEFNFGTSETMDKYASAYYYLDEYLKNRINRPDDILKYHCENLKLELKDSKINHKLVLSLCNIIGITGDSGTGKTTLMKHLEFLFNNEILKLECDRYHKWERGDKNWDNYTHLNPEANYISKFSDDVYNLKIGNEVYQVDYDHSSGKFTSKEKIKNENNIVLCGLHTLFDEDLNKIIDFKIYLDTDEKLRRYWKIKRDVFERGYNKDKVINLIEKRMVDYDKYIKPQQNNADMIIRFFTDENFDYNNFECDPPIYLSIIILKKYNFIGLVELLNDESIEYEIINKNSGKIFSFYKIQNNFNKLLLKLLDKYLEKYNNFKNEISYYTIINCFIIYLLKN